eukprot:g19783.t1
MNEEEDEAIHDDGTTFYVLYLETIHLSAPEPTGLKACIHWYIGDVDYSSVPFTIPADTTSYELKNCGFVVVPQAALDADAEKNSLTISITSWEGEHLGVFFGHCADIATSETFDKHDVELLHEDGAFARAELHAARQSRWTMSKVNQTECAFVDPSTDPQAKHIWEFIAPGNDSWKGMKAAGVAPPASETAVEGAAPSGSVAEVSAAEVAPASAADASTGVATAKPADEPEVDVRATVTEEADAADGDAADPSAAAGERKSSRRRTSVRKAAKEDNTAAKAEVKQEKSSKPPEKTEEKKSTAASPSPEKKKMSNVLRKSAQKLINAERVIFRDADKTGSPFRRSKGSAKAGNNRGRAERATEIFDPTAEEVGAPGTGRSSARGGGGGVKKFLLDKGVEQLNEYTNKMFSAAGCDATLMHPASGKRMPIRMRILMKKAAPVPGSEVAVAETGYLEVAKNVGLENVNPFAGATLLKSIKLKDIKSLFLGKNLSTFVRKALRLDQSSSSSDNGALHDLCVTMQLSEALEFLTIEFVAPGADEMEDGGSPGNPGQQGNKAEYLPEFVELIRSYSGVTIDDGDDKHTGNVLSKNQFPDVRKTCVEILDRTTRDQSLEMQRVRLIAAAAGSLVGGGGGSPSSTNANRNVSAMMAGYDQESPDADPAPQGSLMKKGTSSRSSARASSSKSQGGGGSSSSKSPSSKQASDSERFLKQLSQTLPGISRANLPEAARQFFSLKLKVFTDGLSFPTPTSTTPLITITAAVVDEWCFAFWEASKLPFSESQMSLHEHLSDQKVLDLPHSLPDHAKLALKYILHVDETQKSDAFFEKIAGRGSLQDEEGLHLVKSAETVVGGMGKANDYNTGSGAVANSNKALQESQTQQMNTNTRRTSSSSVSPARGRRRSLSSGTSSGGKAVVQQSFVSQVAEVAVPESKLGLLDAVRSKDAASLSPRVVASRSRGRSGGEDDYIDGGRNPYPREPTYTPRSKPPVVSNMQQELRSNSAYRRQRLSPRQDVGDEADFTVPPFAASIAQPATSPDPQQGPSGQSVRARSSRKEQTPRTGEPANPKSSSSSSRSPRVSTSGAAGDLPRGGVKEIGTYQVMRNGISILVQPVYGDDVVFTGNKASQGSVIISDAVVTLDSLRYLRLIDKSGWVVDDSIMQQPAAALNKRKVASVPLPVQQSSVAQQQQQQPPLDGLQPLSSLAVVASKSGTAVMSPRSRAFIAQDHAPDIRIHGHPDVDDDGDVPSLARPMLGGSTSVADPQVLLQQMREDSKNSAKYLISPGLNGRPHLLSMGASMGERDMPIGFDAVAEPMLAVPQIGGQSVMVE